MNSTQNPKIQSSNLLMASMKSAATTKQRTDTLARLESACDALCATGKNFTLRELEEYCFNNFGKGPNAQTISNDRALRSYVEARKSEMNFTNLSKPPSTLICDIDSISDLTLRSRMRLLYEDHRLTQKRLRILNESLRTLSPPLNLDTAFHTKNNFQSIQSTNDYSTPRPDEIAALRIVVSTLNNSDFLRKAGLDVDEGDIVGRGLRETIIAAKHIKLLRDLLEKLENRKS